MIIIFPDFIKHYDIIRSILRDIYLYGCYSREDLSSKNHGSSRKVSYEMRRIKQYIEKDFIKVDIEGKNKFLSLSYDSITNTKNFLISTYYNKSFTKSDLILYYYLLLILNYSDKPLIFTEILDELSSRELIDFDKISSKTIERKLNEIHKNMELVSCEKRGRAKEYSISNDILENLTDEEVEKLYYISELYKNIIFPNVSGYYFCDTLKDYIKFERNLILVEKDCFQYKNLLFHPVIEEELVLKLMNAIENNNEVILKTKNRYEKKYNNEILKPVKLRYDVNHGRFYLFSYSNGRCIGSRLDRKDKVEVLDKRFDYEKYLKKYNSDMKKSFSSVPLVKNAKLQSAEFCVNIYDKSEFYIVENIKRELKDYEFQKISDNEYKFMIEVNNLWEMIPWIRKYGGYLKVISPIWLKDKITEDYQEMIKMYKYSEEE